MERDKVQSSIGWLVAIFLIVLFLISGCKPIEEDSSKPWEEDGPIGYVDSNPNRSDRVKSIYIDYVKVVVNHKEAYIFEYEGVKYITFYNKIGWYKFNNLPAMEDIVNQF